MIGPAHEFPLVELVARVHCSLDMEIHGCKELAMSENGIRGVDLFKIAGESISGWVPSWKLGGQKPTRQPFCSLMEERLLLYLEYHPQKLFEKVRQQPVDAASNESSQCKSSLA